MVRSKARLCAAVILQYAFVIPGRRQRVRAKRGPLRTNPESSGALRLWIPGSREERAPE
jgi:hypothetical protein